MAGPEYTDVEKPFIDQRVGQGWELRIPRHRDRPFRSIVTDHPGPT